MGYASRTPDREINILELEEFAMKQKKSVMRPMSDEERARLVGPTEAFRERNFPSMDIVQYHNRMLHERGCFGSSRDSHHPSSEYGNSVSRDMKRSRGF